MTELDFNQLLDRYGDGETEGWILVRDKAVLASADALLGASFIVADDEGEERELMASMPTFMELPTFGDVVITEGEAGRSAPRDVAEGCLYYLEKDTFRD